MSRNGTQIERGTRAWAALPSLMLVLGFALNIAWLAMLAWGVFELAGWVLS